MNRITHNAPRTERRMSTSIRTRAAGSAMFAAVAATIGLTFAAGVVDAGPTGPAVLVPAPDALAPVTMPEGIGRDDAVRAFGPVAAGPIVLARPFRLETPATHTWRAERPEFTEGWIVVLDVDPAIVTPTPDAEPVLYGGAETVARVNHGHLDGRVVGILPTIGAKADLSTVRFFFGDADLPERISADDARVAVRRAVDAGIAAPDAEERAASIEAAEPVVYADRYELMLDAMRLVRVHAPGERDLADGWLLPIGE